MADNAAHGRTRVEKRNGLRRAICAFLVRALNDTFLLNVLPVGAWCQLVCATDAHTKAKTASLTDGRP